MDLAYAIEGILEVDERDGIHDLALKLASAEARIMLLENNLLRVENVFSEVIRAHQESHSKVMDKLSAQTEAFNDMKTQVAKQKSFMGGIVFLATAIGASLGALKASMLKFFAG